MPSLLFKDLRFNFHVEPYINWKSS